MLHVRGDFTPAHTLPLIFPIVVPPFDVWRGCYLVRSSSTGGGAPTTPPPVTWYPGRAARGEGGQEVTQSFWWRFHEGKCFVHAMDIHKYKLSLTSALYCLGDVHGVDGPSIKMAVFHVRRQLDELLSFCLNASICDRDGN